MNARHILLLIVLCCGCQREQWDDCITSTGPQGSEERLLAAYHAITLEDRIDLVLEDRPVGTVVVEAGRNVRAQVVTEVREGHLRIRNDNRCNWMRSFKPRITVRATLHDLRLLQLLGSGNVSSTGTISGAWFTLDQDGGMGRTELRMEVDSCNIGSRSGAGDLICTGSARAGKIFQSGTGHVDAKGLSIGHAVVKNDGIVDLYCRATESLTAIVDGSGGIRYAGSPAVLQVWGTGSGAAVAVP